MRDLSEIDVAEVVMRLEASYATSGLDYDAAIVLFTEMGHADADAAETYRRLIEREARERDLPWMALVVKGREAIKAVLSSDTAECFRRAGIFDDPPSQEALAFFDRLANWERARKSLDQLDSGRCAERWSFELEVQRSAAIPAAPAVKWVALDDNQAGFDIESTRLDHGRPTPKRVEVKSCRGRPLRMIVSRNEWKKACESPESYFFHLWDMQSRHLYELNCAQIGRHIPVEQGDGRWDSVTIVADWLRAP